MPHFGVAASPPVSGPLTRIVMVVAFVLHPLYPPPAARVSGLTQSDDCRKDTEHHPEMSSATHLLWVGMAVISH